MSQSIENTQQVSLLMDSPWQSVSFVVDCGVWWTQEITLRRKWLLESCVTVNAPSSTERVPGNRWPPRARHSGFFSYRRGGGRRFIQRRQVLSVHLIAARKSQKPLRREQRKDCQACSLTYWRGATSCQRPRRWRLTGRRPGGRGFGGLGSSGSAGASVELFNSVGRWSGERHCGGDCCEAFYFITLQ